MDRVVLSSSVDFPKMPFLSKPSVSFIPKQEEAQHSPSTRLSYTYLSYLCIQNSFTPPSKAETE
jgi:hypothetical protein